MTSENSLTLAITAAIIAVVFIAAFQDLPRCHPGDAGIYVGGMLTAGCPNSDHQSRR